MAWNMEELYWGHGNCSILVMSLGSLALGSGETQGSIFWDDIRGIRHRKASLDHCWEQFHVSLSVNTVSSEASSISRSTSDRALNVYSRWSKWMVWMRESIPFQGSGRRTFEGPPYCFCVSTIAVGGKEHPRHLRCVNVSHPGLGSPDSSRTSLKLYGRRLLKRAQHSCRFSLAIPVRRTLSRCRPKIRTNPPMSKSPTL